MPIFDKNDPDAWERTDWSLLRESPITLYDDPQFLDEDLNELFELGYRACDLDCAAWKRVRDFHRDIAEGLGFPAYYGGNLAALRDCASELAFPEEGGLVLVLRNVERLHELDAGVAAAVLEIFAEAARQHLLFGDRLIVLIQSSREDYQPEPIEQPLGRSLAEWRSQAFGESDAEDFEEIAPDGFVRAILLGSLGVGERRLKYDQPLAAYLAEEGLGRIVSTQVEEQDPDDPDDPPSTIEFVLELADPATGAPRVRDFLAERGASRGLVSFDTEDGSWSSCFDPAHDLTLALAKGAAHDAQRLDPPKPPATSDDVQRIVDRDFAEAEREAAHSELADLSSDRLRLAVLKLAAGSLSDLKARVELAMDRPEAILAEAELPRWCVSGRFARQESEDEQAEALEADRQAWRAWLEA